MPCAKQDLFVISLTEPCIFIHSVLMTSGINLGKNPRWTAVIDPTKYNLSIQNLVCRIDHC